MLYVIIRFLLLFLTGGFFVSVSFFVFWRTMPPMEVDIIRTNARYTFLNLLFVCALFAAVNVLYRRLTVERNIERITGSLEKIMHGDFRERIKPIKDPLGKNEFNPIINGINLLAQELSGVETLRSDFIANVSHELKTPLTVIGNYGTLLRDPELSEEKRLEYAAAITRSATALGELIVNILRLNKLANQNIYPEKQVYCLSDQLCECLLVFENEWERRHIQIETAINDGICVDSDASLLSLVWNNLFSNALKFTADGGTVCVSLKETAARVEVTVADTGCGMSEETVAHIFEKFYQGDSSHATRGNGLGLALVRRALDITGGEISVQSAPGAGSKFVVTLAKSANKTKI